ncbi:MAG: spermidine/putrescine ABC transporter substrate-binding protein, partial [Gammaproteobacteria bacterium]|nr:spermidine/putrescine ABC transporter substrate-binding protein [Gammaproteobacteria bacterium]
VPFFWGTTGIGYRKDLIPEGFKSWKDFFNPPESLRGKIVMMNYSRDIMGAALKALGYSLNSNNQKEIEEAEQLLKQQEPYVHSYGYITLDEESELVTGEVWASMMYSGDALQVQEYNENIVYVLPEEGSNIWMDYLTVAAASNKKELAMQFINFLNEPEIAARMAEFVYYATPNKAAEQYLPEEYFEDPVIYPSEEELSRSEFHKPLAPRAQQYTNELIARLVK